MFSSELKNPAIHASLLSELKRDPFDFIKEKPGLSVKLLRSLGTEEMGKIFMNNRELLPALIVSGFMCCAEPADAARLISEQPTERQAHILMHNIMMFDTMKNAYGFKIFAKKILSLIEKKMPAWAQASVLLFKPVKDADDVPNLGDILIYLGHGKAVERIKSKWPDQITNKLPTHFDWKNPSAARASTEATDAAISNELERLYGSAAQETSSPSASPIRKENRLLGWVHRMTRKNMLG